MLEKEAKKQLREIMKSFTTGSVLHLLAEIHRKNAEQAMKASDDLRCNQHCLVEHTLIVVGMGCDAALPQ